MTLDELIRRVADSLHRERVPFLLIGGLAVSTWVEPRATRDMDIVLKARRRDAPRVKKALVAAGARATALELRMLMEKRFVRFKTGGPLLDVRICSSPHDESAFERSIEIDYDSRKIRVASPEDLVLYKLQAWRPVDQRDLIVLLDEVGNLDEKYIASWLERDSDPDTLVLRERWREIRKKPG